MNLTLPQQRERYLASGDDRELPIIDAHMHLWDPRQNYHPWLCDEPMIPFRYGDYAAIRRPFLPHHYRALTGEHKVYGVVYMEAEWDPRDPLGEIAWLHHLAEETRWPNAVIGQAWLDREDIDHLLAQLSSSPLVRGVRHKPAALPRADYYPGHQLKGSMNCPIWQQGYQKLAQHHLLFELQTPWWHLPDAASLLTRFPDVKMVINHAGLPGDRDPQTLAGWHDALRQLAAIPDVTIKISGLGLPSRSWCIEDNQQLIRQTIELFGPERCMFASNFPVDSLVTRLDALFDALKAITADYSPPDRLKMFCDNAARIYRLDTKL
ncbi:amidohydrolase family protein [Zobellella taiwanensis]|nr:amidohydrolase family protein [Zobellella taiwanensis]